MDMQKKKEAKRNDSMYHAHGEIYTQKDERDTVLVRGIYVFVCLRTQEEMNKNVADYAKWRTHPNAQNYTMSPFLTHIEI